jgi:nucleoside-diphosphate-sugar epimerase
VRDVVDVFDRCLTRTQAVGRVYNVAGRAAATAEELTRLIVGALGSRSMVFPLPAMLFPLANRLAWRLGEPLVIPELEADAYAHTCFGIERAVYELGWRPKYDTVQALTETAAWYRDHAK